MLSLRFLAPAAVFSLGVLMLPPPPAAAQGLVQTPAVGFASGAYGVEDNAADSGVSSFTLGFEFTANSPVFVTSLGFFNDPSFDPRTPFNSVALGPPLTGSYSYRGSHQVGLFQVIPGAGGLPESGLLLASATITATGTPQGDFLYTTIAPIALVAGRQYVLAGVTGAADPYVFNVQDSSGASAMTTSAAITYGQDRYTVGSTLTFPGSTDAGSEPGFIGPNMLTSPVPEASTFISLGLMLSLAALGMRARRRSRLSSSAQPD